MLSYLTGEKLSSDGNAEHERQIIEGSWGEGIELGVEVTNPPLNTSKSDPPNGSLQSLCRILKTDLKEGNLSKKP